MVRDQVTILRRDQIRLHEIRPALDGQRVALERMVREIAGGAAVTDDEGFRRIAFAV